jgi:hypothetical protein
MIESTEIMTNKPARANITGTARRRWRIMCCDRGRRPGMGGLRASVGAVMAAAS